MPTATYTPLANLTLSSSASSVTFSSIPTSGYRDLVFVFDGTTNAGGAMNIGARFNGDTGSNYSNVFIAGDGSTTVGGSGTSDRMDIAFVSGTRGNALLNIMEYSSTDKHKTSLGRYNNQAATVVARVYRWANTAAVTSINLYNSSGNGEIFAAGSTFALYGIAS